MNKLAKNLVVVLLAVVMFFTHAMTAVEAKGRGGKRPQPTPEPTVEPIEEELIIEDEISEEEIIPEEEEVPAEAPVEETIEETAEEVLPEEEAIPAEEPVAEVQEETEPELEYVDFQPGASAGINAISGAPATSKELYENGDGTYTLALNVTGAAESSSQTKVAKSNVILIIDTSGSMDTAVSGGGTRLSHTITAANTLVTELLKNNKEGTQDGVRLDDIIEISVITFAGARNNGTNGYLRTPISMSTDEAAIHNAINNLTAVGGTNWEAALRQANTEAQKYAGQTGESTSIIFLTDGKPTFYGTNDSGTGGEANNNVNTCWTQARDDARALVTNGYTLYNIFAFGTDSGTNSGSNYLKAMTNYAYTTGNTSYNYYQTITYPNGKTTNDYFFDASDTETLTEAFNTIIDQINNKVGYTNVELKDEVTALTSSSISADISGEVTGFKYYRSGGDYGTADPEHGNYGQEWADAPHAKIVDGKVDWDLDDMILENGVTYTITFIVWPSQSSLDLVADLNNGLRTWDSLTDAEKESVVFDGTYYTLKTNTDYPTVTYSTVTTTTSADGTETIISDPVTVDITNPDPVSLAGSEMTIRKIWSVDLQSWRLNGLLYNEDGTSKELTVKLDVYKEGEFYKQVELGWDAEAQAYVWADDAETIWEEALAVAPGVITSNPEMATYAKSTITFEGTTYYVLETGHDYEIKENDFKDYHFDLVTVVYHPMLVDGELKTVKATYEGEGENKIIKSIEEMDNLSSLEATNTLRGGINLNKTVLDADGKEIEPEDEFEFTIALTNEKEVFVDDSIPWFSVNGNYYHDADGNYISEEEAIEMYGDAYEQYGNILAGSATAVSTTLSITQADTVRIANVPVGTEFTVTEAEYAAYELTEIEHHTQLSDGTDQKPGVAEIDLEKREIVGEIVPDRENNITYTNKAKPVFYVYHSSDNTIERITMEDDRVVDGKFNIVDETKSGFLYGGYFKAYSGQILKDADIKVAAYENGDSGSYQYFTAHPAKGDWAEDTGAEPYTGAKATAWRKANAYTVKGTAMTPAAGSVYYLKEVPDTYLRPYIQVVYDERAGNEIVKLFKITATDDANYTRVGFNSTAGDDSSTKLAASIKITSDDYPSKNVTLTAKGIFTVPRGYLTSIQTGFDATFTMLPYFKTLDGVKVYGVMDRTVDPGNGKYTDKVKPGITTDDTAAAKKYE